MNEDIDSVVNDFSKRMKAVMHKSASQPGKEGWSNAEDEYLLTRLDSHLTSLYMDLTADGSLGNVDPDELVHIANYAMMLRDNMLNNK